MSKKVFFCSFWLIFYPWIRIFLRIRIRIRIQEAKICRIQRIRILSTEGNLPKIGTFDRVKFVMSFLMQYFVIPFMWNTAAAISCLFIFLIVYCRRRYVLYSHLFYRSTHSTFRYTLKINLDFIYALFLLHTFLTHPVYFFLIILTLYLIFVMVCRL